MTNFTETSVYSNALVNRSHGVDKDQQAVLQEALNKFRERAQTVAGDINRSLPEFTVHDISHLDALWEMADLVVGGSQDLTPVEAFVLGGAFLIHDLGMGLAAYPGGLEELRTDYRWSDAIAAAWHSERGKRPSRKEIEEPPAQILDKATAEILRLRHAEQAEHLALTSWESDGTDYHLIEDPELRAELGPIIGRIAHSHWWSVEELGREFQTNLGAPPRFPRSWTTDPLKIACILRVSDASHIDARRAPPFLRAVRQPEGFSEEHWHFQSRLHKPQLQDDRLLYTANRSFSVQEANAWWLCHDTLSMVDRELRQVDALLGDTNRQRLQARGIVGIEEPSRLAQHIRTEQWSPVDARVRVGDVARLVTRLGGEELYGNDRTVPLRELIQNACDAVRARRVLEDRAATWGEVTVTLEEDSEGTRIDVEDTGVGMSTPMLTDALLNFGTSFWDSESMRLEFPGLLASDFKPTGKYGIGFFSVFMWGQRVQVITRQPELAQSDTLVLEFQNGLDARPIVRRASPREVLRDGGTCVRVWLHESPQEPRGLLYSEPEEGTLTLEQVCTSLCPSIDVDLYTSESGEARKVAVRAQDWKTMDGEDLLRRLGGPQAEDTRAATDHEGGLHLSSLGRHIRPLEDEEGNLVGRMCIALPRTSFHERRGGNFQELSAITIGGFKTSSIGGTGGIITGESKRASRDVATPSVRSKALQGWASEQAQLLSLLSIDKALQVDLAQMVALFGGDTGNLAVARTLTGWKTYSELYEWSGKFSSVILVDSIWLRKRQGAELLSNVIEVESGIPGLTGSVVSGASRDTLEWLSDDENVVTGYPLREKSLQDLAIRAVASSWGVDTTSLMQKPEEGEQPTPRTKDVTVAYKNSEPIVESAVMLNKPQQS